jgi:nucleoside-diphosphate-sugar epimerase
MKTAIVTGAGGFIGGAVVKELADNNVMVVAITRPGSQTSLPQSPLVTVMPLDMGNLQALSGARVKADVFYHFAWQGSAGPARADTTLQLQNVQWTIDCLRLARKAGCRRFISAGSIMEHEAVAAAYTPGHRPGPGNIYGGGKLAAHVMSASVAADLGLDLVWAEITNAYGAGEKSPRFINSTIRKIINREELLFTSGTQIYDFVYITDVARAFHLIGRNGRPFCGYLIGSSRAKPLREFLLEMKASIAPDRDFIFGGLPYDGVSLPPEKFDCARTERDTGFRAEIGFAEGVGLTRDWLAGEMRADDAKFQF